MSIEHELIQVDEALECKIFDFKAQSIDRYISPHWHGSMEMLICLEGQLNVWLDTAMNQVTLAKNDILLVNANVVHATQSPLANHILVLQFPYSFLRKVTEGKYNNEFIFSLNTSDTLAKDDRLLSIIQEIVFNQEQVALENKLQVKANLYQLLTILVKDYQQKICQKTRIQAKKNQQALAEIVGYIRQHFQEDLSLTEVAASSNYSSAYFSKLFKKQMGMNYTQYLTSVRLEHAYNLLINSDWSITEIAIDAGFNNVRTFYNAFERLYQMAPSEFRKLKKDK